MSSILLFGVTGLVGSHLVLDLQREFSSHSVTVYLRNNKIDDYLLHTARVNRVVHGAYDEHEKISNLAKEHDIVINVGSSWDTGLSEAIVAGLSQRPKGAKKILIHMSGTGNFVETRWADGAHHEESKVWSDGNIEDMKLINPEMLNGGPDTVVLNAGKEKSIDTYIIFPCALYGESEGPVRALGVVQLLMYEKAKELGFVPYIGEGTAILNAMHAKDAVRFTLRILSKALEGSVQGNAYERCYIIGSSKLQWKAAANAFAQLFHSTGLIDSPEAKSVSLKEAGAGEIPMLMSHDMKFISPRAESLGYQPTEKSLIEFLKEEGAQVIPHH